jgi:hypothetical protein
MILLRLRSDAHGIPIPWYYPFAESISSRYSYEKKAEKLGKL